MVSDVRGDVAVLGPASEPDDKPGSVRWSRYSSSDGWRGGCFTMGVGFGGTDGSGGGIGFGGGNLYVVASSGGGGLYVGASIGGGGIGGPGLARFRYRAISSERGGVSRPSLALRSWSTLIWSHTRRNSVVAATALAASSMALAIPLLPSLNSSLLISVRTCWNSSDRR